MRVVGRAVMTRRVHVPLTVLCGRFDSQPEALAAFLDATEAAGLHVDLEDIDVIRHAPEVRLAHYFRPAIVARIQNLQGADDTVIVLKPSQASQTPGFLLDNARFTRLGVFAGTVVEQDEE